MEFESDITIIGAGPAGSTAAYLLTKSGFRVIIIDKSVFPRDKLCGGLITKKTINLLERVYGEKEESLKEKSIINFYTNKFYFLNKEKILKNGSNKIPTYFVERTVYDKYLLEKAVSSGAKFIYDEEVKKIEFNSNIITTSKGNKIQSRYIIGADGANSVLRKEFERLGILENKYWLNNLGFALETFLDKDKLPFDKDTMYLYFGYIKTGYIWIFPKKEKAVIGVGGLLNKLDAKDMKKILTNFLISLRIDEKTVDTCIKNIKGHPIPFGNYIFNPVYNNTILIGDAAGLVNPLTGEGIYYAQRSAELVADAINKDYLNKGKLEEEYLKNINLYVMPELLKMLKIRSLYFNIFNNYFLGKLLMFLMFRKIS